MKLLSVLLIFPFAFAANFSVASGSLDYPNEARTYSLTIKNFYASTSIILCNGRLASLGSDLVVELTSYMKRERDRLFIENSKFEKSLFCGQKINLASYKVISARTSKYSDY